MSHTPRMQPLRVAAVVAALFTVACGSADTVAPSAVSSAPASVMQTLAEPTTKDRFSALPLRLRDRLRQQFRRATLRTQGMTAAPGTASIGAAVPLAQDPSLLFTFATALNSKGTVVGEGGFLEGEEFRTAAIRWDGTRLVRLGAPAGFPALFNTPTDVSNGGTVVGVAYNADFLGVPVTWSAAGVATRLPGGQGMAAAVDDDGTIVGTIFGTPTDAVLNQPSVWRGGVRTVLPTLTASGGGAEAVAGAWIAGSVVDADGYERAALWRNGRLIVPTVPGITSRLTGVNASGDAIGFYRGTDFMRRGFVLRGGRVVTLDFDPTAISQEGVIVGDANGRITEDFFFFSDPVRWFNGVRSYLPVTGPEGESYPVDVQIGAGVLGFDNGSNAIWR